MSDEPVRPLIRPPSTEHGAGVLEVGFHARGLPIPSDHCEPPPNLHSERFPRSPILIAAVKGPRPWESSESIHSVSLAQGGCVCVCAIFSYKIVIQFYAPKSRAMWLRDFESLRIIFFLEESRQHLPVLKQRASNSERVLVGSRLWNWRESLSKTGRAFPTNVVFLNMFDQWNNLYRLGDCVTHLSDPRSTGFRHPFQREGFPP